MNDESKTWHYYLRKLALILLAQFVVLLLGTYLLKSNSTASSIFIFYNFIISLVLTLYFNKRLDHRDLRYLGFNGRYFILPYLFGAILGMAMIGLSFLLVYFLGLYHIERSNFSILLTAVFLIGVVIQSLSEEVMIRGYFLKGILKTMSLQKALLFQALVFAFFHSLNPHFSIVSAFNIFAYGLIAGIIFYRTDSIYIVAGMHFMWNFLQGEILGIDVSGLSVKNTVLRTTVLKNNILSGGSFGLEGSVITSCVMIIALILVYYSNRTYLKKPLLEV